MKEWLHTYLSAIVADPASLSIEERRGQVTVTYQVRVSEGDVGRVKGRQGRLVLALQSILGLARSERPLRHIIDVRSTAQE